MGLSVVLLYPRWSSAAAAEFCCSAGLGWNEWTERELKGFRYRIHFGCQVPQCTAHSAHAPPVSWVVQLQHAGVSRMFQPNLWGNEKHQAGTTDMETSKPDHQAKPAPSIFRAPLTIERIIRVVFACRQPRQHTAAGPHSACRICCSGWVGRLKVS
jgi:hypothetical protein